MSGSICGLLKQSGQLALQLIVCAVDIADGHFKVCVPTVMNISLMFVFENEHYSNIMQQLVAVCGFKSNFCI